MIIYPFTLAQVAIVLGIVYVLSHGFALWKFEKTRDWLLAFHRNKPVGYALFGLATLWFILLLANIDLMEWSNLEPYFIAATVAIAALGFIYLPEYLGVRGVGGLLLLLPQILLDAAFLHPSPAKYVITVTAYAYAITGICLGCTPWLWREGTARFFRSTLLAKAALAGGIAFGFVLILLGALVY